MNEKERKKVKFSLTKFTKKGSFRFVGFGEIDNENLYTKSKIYEDCIRYCHKLVNSTNNSKAASQNLKKSNLKTKSIKLLILKLKTATRYGLEF